MRAALAVLLLCPALAAQDQPVMRGTVIGRDLKTGEFSLRAPGDRVVRYRFDSQTYIERENRSIDPAQLRAGDPVEVISEAVPGADLRCARSIHVIAAAPPPRHPPVRLEAPQGDLTFAGLIVRITPNTLVLHPHQGDDQEIRLRPDTAFSNGGEIVSADALSRNMRVFVRGGRNDSGNIEAFQVVWGSMLAPQ